MGQVGLNRCAIGFQLPVPGRAAVGHGACGDLTLVGTHSSWLLCPQGSDLFRRKLHNFGCKKAQGPRE